MSLRTWWNNLFKKKKPSPAPSPAPSPVTAPTFFVDFSKGDLSEFTVSTWSAPGASPTNKGTFTAGSVYFVPGALCLQLAQIKNSNGTFNSVGGEIATNQKFGYGTYEFVVRASSTSSTPDGAGTPVSGSITGCFNYLTGSATEIDVEVEGGIRSRLTQFTSWIGENKPNQTLQVTPATNTETPESRFFTYKFVWSPGKILFYRDNVNVATFTNVVPTDPASFMFNHWGTDNPNWGGPATADVTRFMYIKSFKYTTA